MFFLFSNVFIITHKSVFIKNNVLAYHMKHVNLHVHSHSRRCGKSYLLFNLFHDYLLDKGIEKKELRNPDNMLKNADIYVTGSNSKF